MEVPSDAVLGGYDSERCAVADLHARGSLVALRIDFPKVRLMEQTSKGRQCITARLGTPNVDIRLTSATRRRKMGIRPNENEP